MNLVNAKSRLVSSYSFDDILRLAGKVLVALLVAIMIIIVIYPFIWLLLSSLKTRMEFRTSPMYAFPESFYWQNYEDAWERNMGLYFQNSVMVTVPSILLIVTLSVSTAFGIEIMRWKFRNSVLLLFLGGILVPVQIVLLPLFSVYHELDLLNNRLGLILVYTVFGFPLSIFLLVGYFKAIQHEILEAAVIDGANIYQIFFLVAVPLVKNAILTIALVNFFFIWNDLLLSITFISDEELKTIQSGLLSFAGRFGQREWGPTFASTAIAVVPTFVIYLLLNNLVIKGLTAGSVKG